MADNEKKRLNANEFQALLHLCAALQGFAEGDAIKTRVETIKGCKGMFYGAKGMLRKVIHEIYDSMPLDQFNSFTRNLRGLRYSVNVRNVGGKNLKDDGRWLSIEALETLCDATRDHCLMCTKDTQEQRKCALAKALDELPCINADENARGCRYFCGL